MGNIPESPTHLPAQIGDLVRELGRLWAASDICPRISDETRTAWNQLLDQWGDDTSLPLLVRKSSLVRGSEITHETGRKIIPTDNAPAQWACNFALRSVTPTLPEIRKAFAGDKIPVSFAHKKEEKEKRKYHCTLGDCSVNKAGWKLCHIQSVRINGRSPLQYTDIGELKRAFFDLLSPSNFFLLPKAWGGLGEVPEFIDGYNQTVASSKEVHGIVDESSLR